MKQEKIYNAVKGYFENNCLTDAESYIQGITREVLIALLHRQTKKVYDSLTTHYEQTAIIARRAGIRTSDVSSFLAKLHEETNYIECIRDGKLKSWRKKHP